jgi:molybdate transport system ATP-binding protein
VTRIRLESGADVTVTLATGRPPGAAVTVAIPAEDVLVSVEPVHGLSARNVYAARIASLERTGVDVTLRCGLDGTILLARVTPAAVADLGLGPGKAVWLAVKSHSVRLV